PLAQPPGLPELMTAAAADAFFGHFLDTWAKVPDAIPAGIRAAYLKASRAAIPSIVADYRASASTDIEHDEADRRAGNRLGMPVTAVQQDLGAALTSMVAASWQAWARAGEHTPLAGGTGMAEEPRAEVAEALRSLLRR